MTSLPHEGMLSEHVERGVRVVVSVERQLCPCHGKLVTARRRVPAELHGAAVREQRGKVGPKWGFDGAVGIAIGHREVSEHISGAVNRSHHRIASGNQHPTRMHEHYVAYECQGTTQEKKGGNVGQPVTRRVMAEIELRNGDMYGPKPMSKLPYAYSPPRLARSRRRSGSVGASPTAAMEWSHYRIASTNQHPTRMASML